MSLHLWNYKFPVICAAIKLAGKITHAIELAQKSAQNGAQERKNLDPKLCACLQTSVLLCAHADTKLALILVYPGASPAPRVNCRRLRAINNGIRSDTQCSLNKGIVLLDTECPSKSECQCYVLLSLKHWNNFVKQIW